MKRMLVNATQPEELRVAIVDGQKLDNLDIEHKSREQKKSNIYKAKITRIEPSLEAAFVDYGSERHGFLPFKEVAKEYIAESARKDGGRPNVKAGIKEGQEILVQIEKEERGNKGAALTTFASLAGRFLVLMPNNPRAGGVSRRIEGEERAELKSAMNDLEIPDGMGIIVRTAGVGRSTEELQWDLDYQVKIWEAIQSAGENAQPSSLIYQESNVIVRALRDYFRSDIGEILVDEPAVFEQAQTFMSQYMPQNIRKLKLYNEDVPLFNRYQIEGQIESAFQREVRLPSGGAIVIDHTEALISIDINSARATKGSDIEETATNTNLEACDEIGRQLRLRDLGGLVVIDFIDMMVSKNQRSVENRLREVAKIDRARVQIGRISRFGLMEMSRQRLRPSLGESSEIVCPRCVGQGTIRTVESLALQLVRLFEEESLKENTGRVLIKMPVPVATYLLNEKRESIREIEERNKTEALLVPDTNLDTPHYEMERIKVSESEHQANTLKSHELATVETTTYTPAAEKAEIMAGETAAVQTVAPPSPIPQPTAAVVSTPAKGGILNRMFSFLSPSSATTEEAEEPTKTKPQHKNNRNQRPRRGRNQRNNQQNDNRSNQNNNNKKSAGTDSKQSNNRNQSNQQRNNRRPNKQQNTNQNDQSQQTTQASNNTTKNENGNQRSNNRNQSRRNNRNNNKENTNQNQKTQGAVSETVGSTTANTQNQEQTTSQPQNQNSQNRSDQNRGNRNNRNRNDRGAQRKESSQSTEQDKSTESVSTQPQRSTTQDKPETTKPDSTVASASSAEVGTTIKADTTTRRVPATETRRHQSGSTTGTERTVTRTVRPSGESTSDDKKPEHSGTSDNTDQNQTQAGSKEQSQKPASGNRPPRSRYNRSGRRRQKSDNSSTDGNTNDQSTPAMKIVSDNPNPSSSGNDHKPAEIRQTTSTNSRPDQTASAKLEGVKSVPDKTTHLEPRSSSDNASRPATTSRSANLKQVETSSSRPAGNVEKPSDAKKNVSSLQPSQLKSTVRSLADKEPTTPATPPKPKDSGPKLQKIETKDHDTES